MPTTYYRPTSRNHEPVDNDVLGGIGTCSCCHYPTAVIDPATLVDERPPVCMDCVKRYGPLVYDQCSDCGQLEQLIHPDSADQRGEPCCIECVANGSFAP
jgi:hypothetical protein